MPKNLWIRFIVFVILPSIFAGFAWGWLWFFYSIALIFLGAELFRGELTPVSAVIAALIGGMALGHWGYFYTAVYWLICICLTIIP